MRIVALLLLAATAWGADRSIAIKADELDAALKAEKAGEAAALIKLIVAEFPKAPPAEQKVAIKSIGNAAACKTKTTRHVAFDALAKLKVEGSSKYLKKWMTASGKKTATESNLKAIACAGEIADKSTLSLMRRLSKHKHNYVAAEATMALGGYKDHSVKTRKKLAMDLIKRMEKYQSGGSRGHGRGAAESTRKELDETGSPMGSLNGYGREERKLLLERATKKALEKLTGEKYRTMVEWSLWRVRAKKTKNPFK
jgi:hypothetical protein